MTPMLDDVVLILGLPFSTIVAMCMPVSAFSKEVSPYSAAGVVPLLDWQLGVLLLSCFMLYMDSGSACDALTGVTLLISRCQ